jgi:uncharacterized protein (TIGR04255 family)
MVYKKNFLEKVIFRVDFDKAELGKLKDFLAKIKKEFPITEEKKGEEGEIKFNLKTKELKQTSSSIKTWSIYNKDKTIKFEIHPNFLAIEYFKYKNSSELLSNVNIVTEFLKDFEIKTINRLGLRYINRIEIKDKNVLDWTKYIDEKLLGSIEFSFKNKKSISRAMGFLVFKENFGDINFNFGLWNSDYPNVLSERIFILDFDAYSRFPLDTEGIDLLAIVEEYKKKIKELFEISIKVDLRNILNKS